MTGEAQARHAQCVADTLVESLEHGDTVAAYLARDGELDLAPLMAICRARCIAVAVPVIEGNELRFATYGPDVALQRNTFGIREPANPVWTTPTLLLAPLVAFDKRGRRLGMGGGYYDRYLNAHPELRCIGVAHDCQRASAVPADATDLALSVVVTESGWHASTGA